MGTYYRGRNKGDTRRISTGVKEWDENLFCTMELRYARIYGKDIMKIEVKDTARVLREGSREFKDRIGVIREGQTLIEWGVYVLRKAREQGVDIVEFERQGDVGTVILNREVIKRATEI